MFRIINRDYVQTYAEIMKEFPGCHFIAEIDPNVCGRCKLLAISEEPESFKELCDYRRQLPGCNYCNGGLYKEGVGVGLQAVVR